MLYLNGALGLVLLGLWLYCLADVVTTPKGECRNLPKVGWFLIVLFLPDLGSIAWLFAGRPRARDAAREPAAVTTSGPEDDEEFLRGLRERAEQQRRIARDRRRADDGPADA